MGYSKKNPNLRVILITEKEAITDYLKKYADKEVEEES